MGNILRTWSSEGKGNEVSCSFADWYSRDEFFPCKTKWSLSVLVRARISHIGARISYGRILGFSDSYFYAKLRNFILLTHCTATTVQQWYGTRIKATSLSALPFMLHNKRYILSQLFSDSRSGIQSCKGRHVSHTEKFGQVVAFAKLGKSRYVLKSDICLLKNVLLIDSLCQCDETRPSCKAP